MLTDSLVELRYKLFQVFYEGAWPKKPASKISNHDNFEALSVLHLDARSQDTWGLS